MATTYIGEVMWCTPRKKSVLRKSDDNKSLKILKWQSEAVNQRADNTMANIKMTNIELRNTTQKTQV